MLEDARPCRLAQVDPDVQALRIERLTQRDLAQARELHHLVQLVGLCIDEGGDMTVRHHHQVAVVVGEQVENDEAGGAAKNDEGVGV